NERRQPTRSGAWRRIAVVRGSGPLHNQTATPSRGDHGMASSLPGSNPSRRWRSRSGCFVLAFASVFCGGFLLAGVFAAVMIVSDLLAGDPNNNLEGDFPWKYLWALFPLPFILVGAGGFIALWFSRRTLGQSPEQQRAARRAVALPGSV